MKPGDLFTFTARQDGFPSSLDGKSGIFLGEREGRICAVKTAAGRPVFAVQFFGETTQHLFDTGMKHRLRPLETN